jgi:RNA recognition motif-containing protein
MAEDNVWEDSNLIQNTQNNRKRNLTDSSLSPQQYPKQSKQQLLDRAMDKDLGSKVRLHISNIPYEMKWQELKDLLRDKVGAEVYVEIFNGPDGRPSGVGLIEVKSAELAKKTIDTMHRLDVRGRQLIVREENQEDILRRIQMSNGGGGGSAGGMGPGLVGPRPGMIPTGSMSSPSTMSMMNSAMMSGDFNLQMLGELGIDPALITNQVFVANLDYKVTVDKLEEIFRIAGNVLSVELKMDKENNKFRGMATVRFEHPIESVQAISLFNGQRLFGRPMSVRMDRWNDPKPQTIPKMLPSGLESIGMGLGLGGSPLFSLGQIANTLALSNLSAFLRNKVMSGGMCGGSGMMSTQRPMGMGQSGMGTGLDIGGGQANLETIIAATIRAVTGQLGGLPVDGSSNPSMMHQQKMEMPSYHGSAVAGGSSGYSAMSQMNQPWGSGSSGPAVGADMSAATGMWASDASRRLGGGGFTSAAEALTASRTIAAESDPSTLYVGNLPTKFTWQSLKDKFKEIGYVVFADVKPDSRQGSVGTVRYKNPDDAIKAIASLNGSIVEGRTIEVRYLNQPNSQFSSMSSTVPGF